MAKKLKINKTKFNEWAKEHKISMYWQEDTFEKKEFMKRLREARFAYGIA